MSSPLFSVICPTHNGEDRLHKSLGSVKSQTFTDYELIVVCDACKDDKTYNIAQSYADLVIVTDVHRDGLARNAGLDAATGEWILFIDDDDWYMHEYCFDLLADAVKNATEDVVDFSFIWKGRGYMRPSDEELYVMVWCRAWRREFIYDNRFNDKQYGSDLDFFNMMIHDNENIKIKYFDCPLYYYNYLREGSLSWMEKKKTLLDIIVTHHDEDFRIGKKFFDMLGYQRIVDMNKVNVILVDDCAGPSHDWNKLLGQYSYHVNVYRTECDGAAACRNIGIQNAQSDWVMFCDFDDMLCDCCSLAMIVDLLPTDECDIIWGKHVMELIWRKSKPYLQTVTVQNFMNTTCKLYRRAFLNDKWIRFDETMKYEYEYAFNAVCLTETPPFRIRELTIDFYPYIKTYRKNSLRHSEEYYLCRGRELYKANRTIAGRLFERGHNDESNQFFAKALCYAYYSIYDPETGHSPGVSNQEAHEFLKNNRDDILAVSASDMDVLMNEVETTTMNTIQRLFNEFHREYYIKNNSLSFPDWLNSIDHMQTYVSPADATADPPVPLQARNREPHIVVYCGTSNVYNDMVTSAKSMLYHTPVDKIYLLTEDDELSMDLPDIFEVINVSNQQYFPHDGPNFENAWTYMCMIRAAFPEMFQQYSRILSLDIDIIVNDDVSDLWDYDMTDYYLAGVPEKQRQKTESDPIYINFGVVMMNLAKLRQDNKQQEIISMLNNRKVDCPEQTSFNEVCAHHILELPAEYNSTVYSHITGRADKERILHYAGQTFWKHYANVKRYSDMSWDDIMNRQAALKAGEHQ